MIKSEQAIKEIIELMFTDKGGMKKVESLAAKIYQILHRHQYYPDSAKYMHPEDRISIVWQVDDVYIMADKLVIDVTHEQAQKVLEMLEVKYSPMKGVSWDDLGNCIREITGNK